MSRWRSSEHMLLQVLVPSVPPISFPHHQAFNSSHRGLEARRRLRSTQRMTLCCGVTSLHEFPKLVQLLRTSPRRRRSTSQTTLQRTYHGRRLLNARCNKQRVVHLGCARHRSRHDGGNKRGRKKACNICGLGCGRTFASMGTEETYLPHGWRARDSCTWRGDTIRQE